MKHILFWSSYKEGETFNEWRNRPLQLSVTHALPLYSHSIHSDAIMYTYQNVAKSNMIEGIKLCDASDLYDSKKAFEHLKLGHSIAHVSDMVRILGAIKYEGVVIDTDAVMMRPFPKLDSFYSSLPAKATGGMARKWGANSPPIVIHDNSWDGKALSSFPIKVGKNNVKEAKVLINIIDKFLNKPKPKNPKTWNFVMHYLKVIIEADKLGTVFEPLYVAPFSKWNRGSKCYSLESPNKFDGKTERFGVMLPSIDDLTNKSYCIQHFFESATDDMSMKSNDFWGTVKEGSLVAIEAKHLLGDDWRKKLLAINRDVLKIETIETPQQSLF